jgi:hypothetical protein
MLAAHAALSFHNENNFLSPWLWRVVGEERFCHPSRLIPERDRGKASAGEAPFALPDMLDSEEALEAERQRLAGILAQTVLDVLGAKPGATHWGFKEIWNGSSGFQHPWDAYDLLFPSALWLHILRHPLEFAASCAAWNRHELTPGYLQNQLEQWAAMVTWSRERRSRPRYFEIRYEDLIQQPRACLMPVLEAMGLPWCSACEAALGNKFVASGRQKEQELVVLRTYRRTRPVTQIAALVGYDL